MAFRVCCSCKNPPGPATGWITRLCKVTSTLGSVLGTEEHFWAPVSGKNGRWSIAFTPATTRAYQLEGFRVQWQGPAENGATFNALWPSGGNSNSLTTPPTLQNVFIPGFFGNSACLGTNDDVASNQFALANLVRRTVPIGGHVSNNDFRGITTSVLTTGSGHAGVFQTRLAYWRMLENGAPVTDIIPGWHPQSQTTQTLNVIADISNQGWNLSSGTDAFELVNEDVTAPDEATYIWSGANLETIRFALSDFEYTGGYNAVKVLLRTRLVDNDGNATATVGNAVLCELLYNGDVIAIGSDSIGSPASGQTTYLTEVVLRDATRRLKESPKDEGCSYIPKDAEPDGFSLHIRQFNQSATRRVAISAIQVFCAPFTYFTEDENFWPIESGYRIPWRKNKVLGFDLWYQITQTSGQPVSLTLGQTTSNSTTYGGESAEACHGQLSIRTTFMPEFDFLGDMSYSIRYLNGTVRPYLNPGSEDTFTFNRSGATQLLTQREQQYSTEYEIVSIVGWRVGNFVYSPPNVFGTGVAFRVNREVPELSFYGFTVNGTYRPLLRYLPESTGHAVTDFSFYHSPTLGTVHVHNQSPGGVWKHTRVTKFVLERPLQISQDGTFTSETLDDLDGWPTEIEVFPAYPPKTYTYTEDDTWTCPDHVTSVTVECFGGGGGGGGVNEDAGTQAGGGGGGGYSKYTNLTVTPGETYDITVGAGGVGGTIGGGNGGNGAATEFSYSGSVLVKALGGFGAPGDSGGGIASGGNGASTGSAIGTTKFSGGNGAAGATNGTGLNGGGGGSSGAPSGSGTNATNSTGATKSGAGSGGSGRSVPVLTPLPGTAGLPPGGGGGGGVAWDSLGSAGYAGGDGRLTLTY